MNKRSRVGAIAASIFFAAGGYLQASAGNGQPMTVKAGYVNMLEVKATYPVSAVFERLKVDAEAQLRQAVERANEILRKAQEDKKPQADIEKMRNELQSEIRIRQDAITQLIMSQSNLTNTAIANAVQSAALDKGVDFVVDTTAVLIGGQKLADTGLDITDLVERKLQPEKPALSKPAEGTKPAE